jgi:hypothetical protein
VRGDAIANEVRTIGPRCLTVAKLNGWRRLWILAGALYAIPVVALSIGEMPSERTTRWLWAEASINVLRDRAGKSGSRYLSREDLFGHASDSAVIARILDGAQRAEDPVYRQRIDSVARHCGDQIERLPLERARYVGAVILLAWAIPLAAVYALGAGVAWVIRGFRAEE